MAVLFFIFFLLLILFPGHANNALSLKHIPPAFYNINTIFLSMILEGLPFILIGAIVSVLIQSYIQEELIRKILPRHNLLAMISAAFVGIFFPICECAVIPVVRGLIKKGLPQHLGVILICSVPIINPIVFLSTYYAFQNRPAILYARMGLAVIAAVLIGGAVLFFFRGRSILKRDNAGLASAGNHSHHQHHEHHTHSGRPSLREQFSHVNDEFFDMAKYFIIGALLASCFQVFFNQHSLVSLGENHTVGPAVMMGMAYLLSVCSTSDAFLAASFNDLFTPGAIVSFLIFGAMIDIKNTAMLLAYFKGCFVLAFLVMTSIVVYVLARLLDILI